MTKETAMIKGHPEFKKMLDDIKLGKIKSGQNKEMLSNRRLTLAMTRIPILQEIMLEREIKDE